MPPSSKIFVRPLQPHDPRIGDLIEKHPESKKKFFLVGYPDDEGIYLSGGRIGARTAPDEIRRHFYRMTLPLRMKPHNHVSPVHLHDAGNLVINPSESLSHRHEVASLMTLSLLSKGYRGLALGGGHDYGYADGKAFLTFNKMNPANVPSFKLRPLVLNFDAHFDVRSPDKGLNSGTPFFRLLTEFKDSFEFVSVGMQSQCNSQAHLDWLKERRCSVLLWEQISDSGNPEKCMRKFLSSFLKPTRPTFISIDIDGFSSAYAPGCSQSFATGFEPEVFLKILNYILTHSATQLMGIYEVSPPLDSGVMTSRLAAQLAHTYFRSIEEQKC